MHLLRRVLESEMVTKLQTQNLGPDGTSQLNH
jgi:hypothetical protein